MKTLRIHDQDNVAVAVESLAEGETFKLDVQTIICQQCIPKGHKLALADIKEGQEIIKYGHVIGHASQAIQQGDWVHSHNLKTSLEEASEYYYHAPTMIKQITKSDKTFMGYVRDDGRVGTRNEIWIINTVGCVNMTAQRIAELARNRYADDVDGIYAFSHQFGCSQLGDDLSTTQTILSSLTQHPNAAGVLVLGLGCENNQLDAMMQHVNQNNHTARIKFFNTQSVEDELETGLQAIDELVAISKNDRRQQVPLAKLVVGLKCGGSDAFSGLTANPLLGHLSDNITACGGTTILSEVPEMFGAEQQLMNRCQNEQTFLKTVKLVNDFKQYFIQHGQTVYENPSPGNKEGGITTLEEKSLGAVQKGGQAVVNDVLSYGQIYRKAGLNLLQSPGNDGVSSTALIASGATILLFTTGRGTPLGFPAPTIKVATNTALAQRKPHWIDFDAGTLLSQNRSMQELSEEFLDYVIEVASGKQTNNERNNFREIAIWKKGVTL